MSSAVDSRSSFLDHLTKDPDRAFEGFYRYARDLLSARPPRPLRLLPLEEREDAIHEIILHCARDDFRILKQYDASRTNFAAWLYVVAHNKCISRWRTGRAEQERTRSLSEDDHGLETSARQEPAADDLEILGWAQIVSNVEELLQTIGDRCRLLLKMAADGIKPREMVSLLRLPADQNKKVADDLRYCRSKLKVALRGRGIDIARLLG